MVHFLTLQFVVQRIGYLIALAKVLLNTSRVLKTSVGITIVFKVLKASINA
jgi:hypothetical protein